VCRKPDGAQPPGSGDPREVRLPSTRPTQARADLFLVANPAGRRLHARRGAPGGEAMHAAEHSIIADAAVVVGALPD